MGTQALEAFPEGLGGTASGALGDPGSLRKPLWPLAHPHPQKAAGPHPETAVKHDGTEALGPHRESHLREEKGPQSTCP